MSVYLKIAVWGTLIMLLSVFLINIQEDMQGITVNDIKASYEGDIVNGNALGSVQGSNEGNHTLTLDIPLLGVFTVPYIGEILFFVGTILNMLWTVLTTLIGILADIALLSTKFPAFLTPIIAMAQLLIVISWYKVLMPTSG